MRFLILNQYLTQLREVKGQIFAKPAAFQLNTIIFQKVLIVATYSFHQRVSRSILNNIACCNSLWMECMLRTVSRNGTASPSSTKSPEGKLGQWPWLTSDSIERHYKHVHAKKLATYPVSGPQEPPKPAKLATIGMYGVSKDQWPRMTFGSSISNVKGHMWSCADTNPA